MNITAEMVKNLRELTGAGMMDCKKALNETNGDMDAAVDFLKKSGAAKAAFEKDLAERKAKKAGGNTAAQMPQQVTVNVNGQNYLVQISYDGKAPANTAAPTAAATPAPATGEGLEVLAPLEGKAYLVQSSSETPKKVGDHVEKGDVICYIEAMKVFNRIMAEKAGTITSIAFTSGDSVEEDDVLMTIA